MCRRLKRLIKEMLVLKKRRGNLAGKLYQQRGRRLEQRLRELAKGSYGDEHSRRIAKRLRKHENELTLFLWEDGGGGGQQRGGAGAASGGGDAEDHRGQPQ